MKNPIAGAAVVIALSIAGAAIADDDTTRPEGQFLGGDADVLAGDALGFGTVIVHLHGIDAPASNRRIWPASEGAGLDGQTCTRLDGSSWECGDAAAQMLSDLVEGRHIVCTADVEDAHASQLVAAMAWTLGTCWSDEVRVGRRSLENSLNALMVLSGFAFASPATADRYAKFVEFENTARSACAGIFSGYAIEPWLWDLGIRGARRIDNSCNG